MPLSDLQCCNECRNGGFKYVDVSLEESVSLTLVLFLDVLDLHQNDSLSATHHDHSSGLALAALQSQGDFFSSFGFLAEDGLSLTSIS